MRLLYLCSDFGIAPAGTKGASIHLRAITAGLAALGHEVLILSPREGPGIDHPARRLLPPGCPVLEEFLGDFRKWMSDRKLDANVCSEIRSLAYNGWAGPMAKAALSDRRPVAVIERLSLFGHLGLDIAEACEVPLIVEVNALMTEEAGAFRSLQMKGLAEEIERRVLERADAVIAVSGPLAARLEGRGLDPGRIHVVPNGVDLPRFADAPPVAVCRRALGLDGAFVVGFAGSLKVWHGVDVLIRAFERLHRDDPSARLLVVGEGPMLASLRDQASRIGQGAAVQFMGAVPHDRIPVLLRAMDVAVAPFRGMNDFYFSPIKLFEYMASGACVVASRLGQIQEVIEDGVNGLLCEPDDPEALRVVLERARQDAALRDRLAATALATVRDRYTWDHAARTTSALVQNTIENRRKAVERLSTVHARTRTDAILETIGP